MMDTTRARHDEIRGKERENGPKFPDGLVIGSDENVPVEFSRFATSEIGAADERIQVKRIGDELFWRSSIGGKWNPFVNSSVLSRILSLEIESNGGVGPVIDYGAIVIHGTTSNPTKGTIGVDKFYGQFSGTGTDRWFEYWGSFFQTGAGSAGSGTYLIQLPIDIGEIDLTRISASAAPDTGGPKSGYCGSGTIDLVDATCSLHVYSESNTRRVFVMNASFGTWRSVSVALSNANLGISFRLKVPVTG